MTREPITMRLQSLDELEALYEAGALIVGDTILVGDDAYKVDDDELPPAAPGTDCDFCDRSGEGLLFIHGNKPHLPPARICEHCIDAAWQLVAAARATREQEARDREG